MQGYLLIGSVGVMLSAIAVFNGPAISAGLYYLLHSTIVMAGMFLVADLIAGQRGGKDDLLVRCPAVLQPTSLGLLFFVGGIAVVGLPPLSGFLGKALIMEAVLPDRHAAWIWGVILVGSLLALLAFSRAGIVLFWDVDEDDVTERAVRWPARTLAPAAGLFAVMLLMTVLAGPLTEYTTATAAQLLQPDMYIRAVLGGVAP
jgi:multicomponent K+:H+ antiporter subunit D